MNNTQQQIYVLRLEDGKYYVGRTTDVTRRYNEHLDHSQGRDAVWTAKYKPIEIISVTDSISEFDEDKCVLEYMNLYGIENVRGGSYSNVDLKDDQKSYIERIMRGANDQCYKCGEKGHFSKNCTSNIKFCNLCGRNNHIISDCYASTHLDGRKLTSTRPIEINKCARCERTNHQTNSCFATTHTNGSMIPMEFSQISLIEKIEKYEPVGELKDTNDLKLFSTLKVWRLSKSQHLDVKPYQVFTDATLMDLAFYKPSTLDFLLRIKGIGPKKVEQYGTELLEMIKSR